MPRRPKGEDPSVTLAERGIWGRVGQTTSTREVSHERRRSFSAVERVEAAIRLG
jgi:hypothetical protein